MHVPDHTHTTCTHPDLRVLLHRLDSCFPHLWSPPATAQIMHIMSNREMFVEFCWTLTMGMGFLIKIRDKQDNFSIQSPNCIRVVRLVCEKPAEGTRGIWRLRLPQPAFTPASRLVEILPHEHHFRKERRRARTEEATPTHTSVSSKARRNARRDTTELDLRHQGNRRASGCQGERAALTVSPAAADACTQPGCSAATLRPLKRENIRTTASGGNSAWRWAAASTS